MAHRGSTAQRRRHARRLARRRQETLVAGAVGGDYPLGDRTEAWDGGAAAKSYDLPGDGSCYMWKDPSGNPASQSTYKLPFVAKSGGNKHAVWKAITSIAGILQGGRGGVQIPDADKSAVKSKVASYYAKARTKYDDNNIKVPWQAAQEAVVKLAAERGWQIELTGEAFSTEDEHYPEMVAAYDAAIVASLAYAEVGDETSDAYHFAVIAWAVELQHLAAAPNAMPCANCDHAAELHAGAMNGGQCEYASCSCMDYVAPSNDDEGGDESKPDIDPSAEESEEFAKKKAAQGDDEDEEDDGEKPGDKKNDEEPDEDEDDVMEKRRQAADKRAAKKRSASLDEAIQVAVDAAAEEGQTLHFMLIDFKPITADGEVTDVEQPIFTGGSHWIATMCPEGTATEDGRVFAPGSITWRELPLSLMGMIETQPGHDGAQVCGRIDNIWREDATGLIRGSGEFDSGEYGSLIARMVGDETLRGISVDIAPIKVEVAKRADVVDENGNWIEKAPVEDEEDEDRAEGPSLLDILFGDDDMLTVVQEGVIGAATVVPFPAFAVANIEIANSLAASDRAGMIWTVTSQAGWTVTARLSPAPERDATPEKGLTASAAGIAPIAPPADWFEDPGLPELTPLTVDDDGRVYGHAAAWGTCHTGIPGTCTTAPTSETDYAYFHLKEVLCDDGSRVPVGTITMDAGHADLELGRAAATDHYDNTATAAADVRVGEDEFGIWVSGCVRPDLDEMSARRLRGATVSGDWRAVRLSDGTQNRELIALLAVNVPGFPVPRPQALVASGNSETGLVITAQIAAGMHAGQEGLTLLEKRQAEAAAMSEEFAELGRALES